MRKKVKTRDRYRKSGKQKRKNVKGEKALKIKKEKTEEKVRHEQKGCYGTKEWSNSGICKTCEWKSDCGEVNPKLKWGDGE